MKLIQCVKCNTEFEDGCKFCPNCGEKSHKEIECNTCKFLNDFNSKFCVNCGKELVVLVKERSDMSIDILKEETPYYYHSNNEQYGGFSIVEFKKLIRNGKIDRNTLISIDGAKTWQWAINVSLFKRILEESPTPITNSAPTADSNNIYTKTDAIELKIWYLTKNGERVGPLSEIEMKAVIENGVIRFGNKVFKEGSVDWVLLENSELGKYLHAPPPLIGSDFRNNTAWWLAFAPVISFIVQYFLIYMTYTNNAYDMTEFFISWGFLIYLVINLILVARDANNLESSGHDTSQFGNIIFIPIYLWKRNKILSQTQATFWFWFLLTSIDIFLTSIINIFAIL